MIEGYWAKIKKHNSHLLSGWPRPNTCVLTNYTTCFLVTFDSRNIYII